MMFRYARAGVIAALAAAFFPAVCAAQAAPSPQPSDLPEIGRVFTSDRHDEPVDRTPRPTFVIDRARIEARGDRTVAQALAGVPGIATYAYGAFGSQSSVFMQGTAASSQVLFLVDGIPIAPASYGEIDAGELSTAGVRRIEVVEGSGSTLYGSSAIGGVINIITSVPRETYLAGSAGSLGERDLRVETGNGHLGASFERHIARNDYAFPAAAGLPAGTRTNADAEQSAARIAYDTRLARGLDARVRIGSDAIALGVPGDLAFGATPRARQRTSRDDAHLELSRSGTRSLTALTLSGSRQRLDYNDPDSGPVTDTNDGRAQISLRNVVTADRSTLTTGVDLSRESAVVTNVGLYDPATFALLGYATEGHAQSQSAAYVQYQIYAGAVRAYAGLRGEHDTPAGNVLSPSAGLSYDAGALRLAANAGSAFRAPTLVDLYYPGASNPRLLPERAGDENLTVATRGPGAGAALEWFGRDVTNLIEADPNANYVPANIARARVRGLQLTLRSAPFHGLVTALTMTDVYQALNLTPGQAAVRLNFAPVFVTALSLEHPFGAAGAMAFGATARIQGPHLEGGVTNQAGETVVDAYLRARLAPRTVLSLRSRNLGDERYSPVAGYPAPGRRYELELSTR